MNVAIEMQDHRNFFSCRENFNILDKFFEDISPVNNVMDMAIAFFDDKDFFWVKTDGEAVGFGCYKEDFINQMDSFMLYELYVLPEKRSLKHLHDVVDGIKGQIRRKNLYYWACCVDNDDIGKQKAYEKLGFDYIENDGEYVYMGMKLKEGL